MSLNLKFHHIGVACKNIEDTAREYAELGYCKGDTIIDTLQNVIICFLSHETMPCVELLASVDENSPVVKILEKNGTTPYHTCYTCENLEETMKSLKKLRYIIVSRPKIACAIENRRVAFLYKSDMGLIELVEAK